MTPALRLQVEAESPTSWRVRRKPGCSGLFSQVSKPGVTEQDLVLASPACDVLQHQAKRDWSNRPVPSRAKATMKSETYVTACRCVTCVSLESVAQPSALPLAKWRLASVGKEVANLKAENAALKKRQADSPLARKPA